MPPLDQKDFRKLTIMGPSLTVGSVSTYLNICRCQANGGRTSEDLWGATRSDKSSHPEIF